MTEEMTGVITIEEIAEMTEEVAAVETEAVAEEIEAVVVETGVEEQEDRYWLLVTCCLCDRSQDQIKNNQKLETSN